MKKQKKKNKEKNDCKECMQKFCHNMKTCYFNDVNRILTKKKGKKRRDRVNSDKILFMQIYVCVPIEKHISFANERNQVHVGSE